MLFAQLIVSIKKVFTSAYSLLVSKAFSDIFYCMSILNYILFPFFPVNLVPHASMCNAILN